MTLDEFASLKVGDMLICNSNAGHAKIGLKLKVVEADKPHIGVYTITLNYVELGMGDKEIDWYIAQYENYDIINESYVRWKHLKGLYEDDSS